MKSLIILADLGRVKAYRIRHDELDPASSPAFEDLVDVDLKNRHSRVSERVTDKAGRFGCGKGSASVGESHNEQQEAQTHQLHDIAQVINAAAQEDHGAIYFAAPKEIIRDLADSLSHDVVVRIRTKLALNLVKAPKLDLLERFGLR